jgi:hypothetical protein
MLCGKGAVDWSNAQAASLAIGAHPGEAAGQIPIWPSTNLSLLDVRGRVWRTQSNSGLTSKSLYRQCRDGTLAQV